MKGCVAGAIAGLLAGAAKMGCEAVASPRSPEQTPPPAVLVEKLLGRKVSDGEKKMSLVGIHFAFSAGFGGCYGSLVESVPLLGAGSGVVAGAALWAVAHEGALPLFGLTVPLVELSAYEQLNELATHLVFGLTLELTRRGLRAAH